MFVCLRSWERRAVCVSSKKLIYLQGRNIGREWGGYSLFFNSLCLLNVPQRTHFVGFKRRMEWVGMELSYSTHSMLSHTYLDTWLHHETLCEPREWVKRENRGKAKHHSRIQRESSTGMLPSIQTCSWFYEPFPTSRKPWAVSVYGGPPPLCKLLSRPRLSFPRSVQIDKKLTLRPNSIIMIITTSNSSLSTLQLSHRSII